MNKLLTKEQFESNLAVTEKYFTVKNIEKSMAKLYFTEEMSVEEIGKEYKKPLSSVVNIIKGFLRKNMQAIEMELAQLEEDLDYV